MSLRESAQVSMVFASLSGGSEIMIMDLPIVCDFPEVFLDGISGLPSEHAVEFAINLIPYTSPVSMASYKMFAS